MIWDEEGGGGGGRPLGWVKSARLISIIYIAILEISVEDHVVISEVLTTLSDRKW